MMMRMKKRMKSPKGRRITRARRWTSSDLPRKASDDTHLLIILALKLVFNTFKFQGNFLNYKLLKFPKFPKFNIFIN